MFRQRSKPHHSRDVDHPFPKIVSRRKMDPPYDQKSYREMARFWRWQLKAIHGLIDI